MWDKQVSAEQAIGLAQLMLRVAGIEVVDKPGKLDARMRLTFLLMNKVRAGGIGYLTVELLDWSRVCRNEEIVMVPIWQSSSMVVGLRPSLLDAFRTTLSIILTDFCNDWLRANTLAGPVEPGNGGGRFQG